MRKKRMDEQNRLSRSPSLIFFITTIKFSSATWWESEKDYINGCRYDDQNDKRKYMARTFHIKVTGVLRWQ
jgi:hypothetical protein